MIAEKLRKAARLRSQGRQIAQEIEGDTQEELASIIAPAKRKALLILGEAEAAETKIKAESFGRDISFYNYWRTLRSYNSNLPVSSQGIIFSTDSRFLKYLSQNDYSDNYNIVPADDRRSSAKDHGVSVKKDAGTTVGGRQAVVKHVADEKEENASGGVGEPKKNMAEEVKEAIDALQQKENAGTTDVGGQQAVVKHVTDGKKENASGGVGKQKNMDQEVDKAVDSLHRFNDTKQDH